MTFDNIIANPPYGKIGVDITKFIINEVPYNDISILGTRAMLRNHCNNLEIEYVYIEDWVLSPVCKVKWVEQVILMGHKGCCEAIPLSVRSHKEEHPNELHIPFSMVANASFHISIGYILTRNRATSAILSVSDEDYEYIKTHWDNMTHIERFWWLHDHGLYRRFV